MAFFHIEVKHKQSITVYVRLIVEYQSDMDELYTKTIDELQQETSGH